MSKLVPITGGTAGIGYETALGLANQGYRVIVVGRRVAAGERAVEDLRAAGAKDAAFLPADLQSQASVRQLAQSVLARYDRLDVLLNNAGAYFSEREETEDGIEATLAVNHVAPFLLTELLMPLLERSHARIVNVNSEAHRAAKPPVDHDPQWRSSYTGWKAYCMSKLINLLWTYELARRVEGRGVTVNALHPGIAFTKLVQDAPWWFKLYLRLNFWRTNIAAAARTSIYVASAAELEEISGKYFVNQKVKGSSQWSLDRVLAQNAWDLSLNLTGTVRGGRSIGSVTAPPGLTLS